MPTVPDRFRLKRYFSIASLIGVLVAVTALSLLYRVTARQALVEHETQSNVALTRALSNTLLPRYMAWIAGAGALSREAWRRIRSCGSWTATYATRSGA